MIRKGNRVNGNPYKVGLNNYIRLERVDLQSKEIFEFKLQEVIANCPDILPFAELDSQLGRFTHLCRELNTNSGPIDNLLLGERGEIAIVETKLWRNSQSKREAFAQIIDYSSQLSKKTYKEFEKMVSDRRKSKESLFEIYTKAFGEGYSETDLIDAVSQTLKQCSFLLLLIGDGIQYGVEDMKEFIDKSPGNLSTMGLVELRVYKLGDEYIFLPMLVQRTVEICRTVVELKDDRMKATIINQDIEKDSNVQIKTYSKQSEDMILNEVKENFGSEVYDNALYLFEELRNIGMEISFNKREHYFYYEYQTKDGLKKHHFIEIWNHDYQGNKYKLKDLQFCLFTKNYNFSNEDIKYFTDSMKEIFHKEPHFDNSYLRYRITESLNDKEIRSKISKYLILVQSFVERITNN
jgi:hypothetical protein